MMWRCLNTHLFKAHWWLSVEKSSSLPECAQSERMTLYTGLEGSISFTMDGTQEVSAHVFLNTLYINQCSNSQIFVHSVKNKSVLLYIGENHCKPIHLEYSRYPCNWHFVFNSVYTDDPWAVSISIDINYKISKKLIPQFANAIIHIYLNDICYDN